MSVRNSFNMGLFRKLFGGDNENYKGDLRNDVPHGKGILKFPDGAVYDGEWEAGTYHGKGKYVFPDGKIQDGQFSKGKFVG